MYHAICLSEHTFFHLNLWTRISRFGMLRVPRSCCLAATMGTSVPSISQVTSHHADCIGNHIKAFWSIEDFRPLINALDIPGHFRWCLDYADMARTSIGINSNHIEGKKAIRTLSHSPCRMALVTLISRSLLSQYTYGKSSEVMCSSTRTFNRESVHLQRFSVARRSLRSFSRNLLNVHTSAIIGRAARYTCCQVQFCYVKCWSATADGCVISPRLPSSAPRL